MADDNNGGGTSFLAFLVGGLLVVVAVIGFAFYNGGSFSPAKKSVDINISAPKVPAPSTN